MIDSSRDFSVSVNQNLRLAPIPTEIRYGIAARVAVSP